jgi:hypothetical protein
VEALSLNRTAAKLVIAELHALCGIIKRASVRDGELVKTWSQSTIVNVLYAVRSTERVSRLVQQAGERSKAFEAALVECIASESEIDDLRHAAIRSVRNLIKAIEEL